MGYWKKSAIAASLLLALSGPSMANPTGPTVRHGQVNITPGVNTQIQQLTDKAIVDWNSFSINVNESVRFLQPSQLSVILNRVTGGDPSRILGQLEANGNIFLINPNGVLFGPNSVVNVGGLVASTLSLSNDDFLSGNYQFNLADNADLAAVVNQGRIEIVDGGYAVLTGPTVINEGFIVAKGGNVVLAAGEQATLNLDGRDLVHFALDGQIGDGTVLLAPGMMSDAVADTLGVSPARRADQLVRDPDGSVRLVSSSGTLVQSGTVSANGSDGKDAGSVLLDSGDITVLADGSSTTASGQGENSDGGEVLVLSAMDGTTTAAGFTDLQTGALVSATGGNSGDGGFVEVSGDTLNLHGTVEISAQNGEDGHFLLDPVIVTIVDGDDAPTGVPSNLTASTIIGDEWFENGQTSANFTLQSSGEILFDLSIMGTNPNGDSVVNFARGGTNDTNVTLIAGADPTEIGDIDFGTGYTLTGLDEFTVNAADNIRFNNVQITTDDDTSFIAGDNIDFGQSVISTDGNTFNINAGGLIDFESSALTVLLGGGATANITAGGDIALGNSTISLDSNFGAFPVDTIITAGGSLTTAATGAQTLFIDGNTDIFVNGGDFVLNNTDFDIPIGGNTTGASRTFELMVANGSISLGDSVIDIDGLAEFTASDGATLGNTVLTTAFGGDVLIEAGSGDIALGSSTINSNGSARFITGGNIDFDQLDLNVNAGASRTFDANAGGSLSFGESTIDVVLGSNATANLIAGTEIAIETSNWNLDSNFGAFPINTLIQAGTSITTGAADSVPGTFTNTLFIDGNTDIVANNGDITLNDVDINIPRGGNTGGNTRTLDIVVAAGSLNLGESRIDTEGDTTFDVSQNMNLGSTVLDAPTRGDILFDVDGNLEFGSSQISQNTAAGQTGALTVMVGGSALFQDSVITLNSGTNQKFDVTATNNIDFGNADIDVTTGGFIEQLYQAGGDIDLGTSTLDFTSTFSGGSVGSRFLAGGSITSGPADSNAATFSQTFISAGETNFIATTGDVNLVDTDLRVEVTSFGSFDLAFDAPNGSIGLGDSSIITDRGATLTAGGANGNITMGTTNITSGDDLLLDASNGNVVLGNGSITTVGANRDLQVFAGNTLDAQAVDLNITGRLALASNGEVLANGSNVTAPDIEIYGFNPTTMMLDSNTPVMNGVTLGLESTGNIDLSVFAVGDINIFHTGGGSITTERAGRETTGTTGSAASLRSTTGNIVVDSDGTLNLGKGPNDRGDFALVEADAANSVISLTAAQIIDVNSSDNALDASAGALVAVVGQTGAEAVDVSAAGVVVDVSANPSGLSRVDIVGDSDFLQVRGNDSDIEVTELASGNLLTVKPGTGDSVLTLEDLGIEGIHYIESTAVSLGSIEVGVGETLAVEVQNGGDITDGRTTGVNLNIQGSLLLDAQGDIGTAGQTVLVPGGRLAAQAGGDLFLETNGARLETGPVELADPLGNVAASAQSVSADGDVTVQLSAPTFSVLSQEGDITSNGGDVAIDIANGDLEQNQPSTIVGDNVALRINGNAGSITTTDPVTELSIQANSVVIDVSGDTALVQNAGDLTIAEQATIGGELYNSDITGEDLRVRVLNGGLTVNAEIDVTGEAALVTGTLLNLPAQTAPNSIILNNNITTTQNLVILSGGDIFQQSGLLTADQLGLGAQGTIGAPVQIAVNQLSLNPANGQVADANGFTQANSVTAAGVTVNQGAPVTTTPDPPANQGGQTIVQVVLFPDTPDIENRDDVENPTFAQNDINMVEDMLKTLFDSPFTQVSEIDPTDPPTGWYNDDDFLKRKWRR